MNAETISATSLYVANLSAALGSRMIIRNCTFDINAREFVTIVGPNGAGKSTLLRVLGGLLPYAGSLQFAGLELARMNPGLRARKIAYLPQNGAVHWPMRVRDVVALGRLPFGARLQRLTAKDEALVEQALHDCDAAQLADRIVTDLSGGELSRVLLARVLAADTLVILVDEPTASLDPAHQISVMRLLAKAAQAGRIVISVSHDIGLAARYATRMIALEHGALAGDGRPAELLDSGVLQRIFGVRFLRGEVNGISVVSMAPHAD